MLIIMKYLCINYEEDEVKNIKFEGLKIGTYRYLIVRDILNMY